MDYSIISEDRKEVLKKIDEYERAGLFDKDVENDPPAPELRPEDVDYLGKKTFQQNQDGDRQQNGAQVF